MGESPQDMVDFIDYVNGPTTCEWGGKRASYGHPGAYGLRYLELGNEERVDEAYYQKFKRLAEAIWARDPKIILIVGDFAYQQPITNAFMVTGADSQIKSLAAQQKILQLAKEHGREVWFDLHVWTDGPRPTSTLEATLSYVSAMEKLAEGARFKVVVLELNANNHSQRRALANALAIHAFERDGRIPVVTSANCLQPDGQNDNGWDQGLLFLNPSQVWLQPPGYVTSMMRTSYLPMSVPALVQGSSDLDAVAKRSEDGKTLILQVVNLAPEAVPATLSLDGFRPQKSSASVQELRGPLAGVNVAEAPLQVAPTRTVWQHKMSEGAGHYTFPPHSFSILKFE
jgi:alpha-L-arabinofuranosidase